MSILLKRLISDREEAERYAKRATSDAVHWSEQVADLDKAIAAISPQQSRTEESVSLMRDGDVAVGVTSHNEVRTQPESATAALFWYASGDEEMYNIGPCDTREQVIAAALADEVGISPDLKRQCFSIIQAAQEPLKLSHIIDVDDIVDRSLDGMLGEACGHDHDPTDLIDHIKKEQWDALQIRLRSVTDEWQAEQKIVVVPNMFTDSTNPERLTYVYVDKKHALAHPWSEIPDEGVRENLVVADGDCYAQIGGEWFGPMPLPEGFAEWTPKAAVADGTVLEFWWFDGKRVTDLADKDWTEPPAAYRIVITTPDLTADTEPGGTAGIWAAARGLTDVKEDA